MKPTIEQLNALSDYEINCAVTEKLGLDVRSKTSRFGAVLCSPKGEVQVFKDFCDLPNDYMPIAIEHGISIVFNQEEVETDYSKDFDQYMSDYYTVKGLPKTQTGRAVCIAFLLMNGESE